MLRMAKSDAERKRAQRARWRAEKRCEGCGSPDRARRGVVVLTRCQPCLDAAAARSIASRRRLASTT